MGLTGSMPVENQWDLLAPWSGDASYRPHSVSSSRSVGGPGVGGSWFGSRQRSGVTCPVLDPAVSRPLPFRRSYRECGALAHSRADYSPGDCPLARVAKPPRRLVCCRSGFPIPGRVHSSRTFPSAPTSKSNTVASSDWAISWSVTMVGLR